jgi:chemotaxis protein methyltransferase CheR
MTGKALGDALVDRFRDLVTARLGLAFEGTRADRLAEVLGERLEAMRVVDARAYVERLGRDREEWRAIAALVTVGETYFFRYEDHFRALRDAVLPERMAASHPLRPFRALSAGAASGEEAYSLAILLRESFSATPLLETPIAGFDVNPRAIEKAKLGKYPSWSLRETPDEIRDRYFSSDGRHFVVRDDIRAMVSFEERNVLDEDAVFWRAESFDLILCRNVLMYLTPEAQRQAVARLTRALRPGGFLFLGHAETLRGLSQGYQLQHTHNTFYYQLRGPRSETAAGTRDFQPWPTDNLVSATPAVDDLAWFDAIRAASERVTALTVRAPIAPLPREASTASASHPEADKHALLEMLRQERFADALVALGALSATSRSTPEARLLEAVLLTNAGKLREAEDVCTDLVTIDESGGAHYLLALCREHAGDTTKAIEHDQTATYLEPAFVMPRLHLGLLQRRAGRLGDARAALTQALALLPSEDPSRILLFGGGFGREALVALCQSELRRCGVES